MHARLTAFLGLSLFLGVAVAQESPASAPTQNAETRPAEDPLKYGDPVPAGAVAVISGKTIPLKAYVDAIYSRWGQQEVGIKARMQLLNLRVIEHNMKKRGISVTEDEIAVEYKKLDDQLKTHQDAKQDIAGYITAQGLRMAEFLALLKLNIALQKLVRIDMKESAGDFNALQMQWLRSKSLEGEIEELPAKLPADAAARVYGEFVTKEDVVHSVFSQLSDRNVVEQAQTLMHVELAKALLEEFQITVGPAEIEAEYKNDKKVFESKQKFQGVSFEDMVRQATGMSPDDYKASPSFFAEVAVYTIGKKLVADDAAAQIYEEDKAYYGPISELHHIFIRGSDDPAFKGKGRTKAEAKVEADKAMERIMKGEKFDELVKAISDDLRTKFNGGLLAKWTPRDWESKPQFVTMMKEMKVGDVRGPVESANGWHIVRLAAQEPAPTMNEDIVRDMRKRRSVAYFEERWRSSKKGLDLRRLWPRTVETPASAPAK